MAGNKKELNESEILKFVDAYIDSFIVWDTILYFFNNPSAAETVSSLSNRLGRANHDVKSCLRDLVKKDILMANDGGEYTYAPSPEMASCIDDFDKALAFSKLRLSILSQVLSKRATGSTRHK
jgi:hypothetical protein